MAETYRRRLIDRQLDDLMMQLPAILLDGPKAVGKTTTALQRAATVRRMDAPLDQVRYSADEGWITRGVPPILVDEWHRAPGVWDSVKRSVDDDSAGGRFLLTGSLPTRGTHSGAGRITSLRMRPLSMAERMDSPPTVSLGDLLEGVAGVIEGESDVTFEQYCYEISQSGFPGFRHLSGASHSEALLGYLERIFDTDLPELGVSLRRPATMRAWLRAYAAATGTLATWEIIREAANSGYTQAPSKPTVTPYRDALTRLRILDELPAWLPTRNDLSRVAQAPKHYVADPALALALLGYDGSWLIDSGSDEASDSQRPLVGRLFEALAILSIRVYAQTNFAQTFHFRQFEGRHEVDAIVQGHNGKLLAIEIKLGATVESRDIRHLKWLQEKLGSQVADCVLIYTGPVAFRFEGVAVVPLALLGA
jgi:hypothetical protein